MGTPVIQKSTLYQHIAASLRDQIAAGHYRPGDQLPSEGALCDQFGVSRITVRGALDVLTSEGLLRREQGRGTFVTEPPVAHELIRLTDFVEDMQAAGLRPASRVTHVIEEPAPGDAALALGVEPGSLVLRLERLRLANNQPIAFDVTWLPLRYGRLLDVGRLETETIYHQLEQQYGIPVLSATFTMEADAASDAVARHLAIPPGTSVFVIRRTSHTTDRSPIYYQIRSYRADRVRYQVELTRRRQDEPSQLTEFVPVFNVDPVG